MVFLVVLADVASNSRRVLCGNASQSPLRKSVKSGDMKRRSVEPRLKLQSIIPAQQHHLPLMDGDRSSAVDGDQREKKIHISIN